MVKRNIVHVLLLGVVSVVLVLSCATTAPMSERNEKFQEESGISIGFALRGLYSLGDGTMKQLYEDILDGRIDFIYAADADYVVEIDMNQNPDMLRNVSIGPIPAELTDADKAVYFTATLGMVSKLKDYSGVDVDKEDVAKVFFEIVKAYIDSGYALTLNEQVVVIDEGLKALESGTIGEFALRHMEIATNSIVLK
ncbi:hypothetical protein [Sediminispirochaeta bajacaliforniensis]|uniref:hypothetical protein n=1 Tax=Sediminispirochaeta bajacaliforniensis TaxID=148 RepID=UPI00037E9280|nr:hypothetical protein [Sediminispirochaeta bajacaliforniensis]